MPSLCGVCRQQVVDDGWLCEGCSSQLCWIEEPFCSVCGIPLNGALTYRCASCIKQVPPYDRAVSAIYYKGSGLKAIRRFKYGCDMSLESVIEGFVRGGIGWLGHEPFDVVVPVPLHPIRLRQRGFNQSALIARMVAGLLDRPLALWALERTRHSTPQVLLEKKARALNVKAAFRAGQPQRVEKKRVLLVDDVMTTGATVKECASELKRAGAERVVVFTVARVV